MFVLSALGKVAISPDAESAFVGTISAAAAAVGTFVSGAAAW